MRARRRSIGIAGVTAGLAGALALTACGSSATSARLGVERRPGIGHGASGRLSVSAHFPATQPLARLARLTITVRNVGARAIPDVAVTVCDVSCAADAARGEGTSVAAFSHAITGTDLADPSRPVWIVRHAPGACPGGCADEAGAGGAVSAASNTWALGRLAPGHVARFSWSLEPVLAGHWRVAWQVAGSLTGTPEARTASGGVPGGAFAVNVTDRVSGRLVTPSGRVVDPAAG